MVAPRWWGGGLAGAREEMLKRRIMYIMYSFVLWELVGWPFGLFVWVLFVDCVCVETFLFACGFCVDKFCQYLFLVICY